MPLCDEVHNGEDKKGLVGRPMGGDDGISVPVFVCSQVGKDLEVFFNHLKASSISEFIAPTVIKAAALSPGNPLKAAKASKISIISEFVMPN